MVSVPIIPLVDSTDPQQRPLILPIRRPPLLIGVMEMAQAMIDATQATLAREAEFAAFRQRLSEFIPERDSGQVIKATA